MIKSLISGKIFGLVFLFMSYLGYQQDLNFEMYRHTTIEAQGDMTGRLENGFVEHKEKFYFRGGKDINPVLPDWKIDKENFALKKVIH